MDEHREGEVFLERTTIDRPARTTTTASSFGLGRGGGDGECDEPKRKKQKIRRDSSKRLCNSNEGNGRVRTTVVLQDAEIDELLPQLSTFEDQKGVCSNGCEEAGGERGEIDEYGGGGGEDGRELPLETPSSSMHLSETTTIENENNDNNEDDDDEDVDDGEEELIPEFDPDEKGNSLFTDELCAAVEEGSELHLPVVDPPPFSANGPTQLLVTAGGTREMASMNGRLPMLPVAAAPPSIGTHYGNTDGLDLIAYKMYAASQQATVYPLAVTARREGQGEGHDGECQQPVDQEHGGDQNPASVDDGERTPRHPRWTKEETAVLLSGKRKRDDEIRTPQSGSSKLRSATERWDSISNYCRAHGVDRDAHQCRKRWSNLAADYKKIRNWHKQSGVESYWSMRADSRRKNKLPGSFDPEVYTDMETTSDCNALKKRKLVPPAVAEDDEEVQHDPLASVLESSGRAMQAALARNIQAQIEAQNQNSELDRVQRKEQSDNLVGVLGLLADSLARIAEKL